MTENDYTWKKAFYDEEFNPAIPLIKKCCQWVIINYPDFSFTYGIKRLFINIFMVFTIAALSMHLLVSSTGVIDFVLRMFVATFFVNLLFLKTVAASVLWSVEKYQAILGGVICKRCGLCCRDCQYLMRLPDGLTSCSIYDKRIGVEIAPGVTCKKRKTSVWDFPGCPYNTGKPLFNQKAKL